MQTLYYFSAPHCFAREVNRDLFNIPQALAVIISLRLGYQRQ